VVNDSDPTAYPVRYFVSASGADIDLRGFDAASDPAWVAVLERAAQRETVQVSRLTQLFGVPGQWGFVARFDNAAGLLDAVQTGRIDVAALTTISLGSLAQTTDFAGVEVTEGFAYREQVGCGAFGFRREDTRFRDEFNRILNQMKDDGELTRLVEPFGFAEAAGAAQGLTAEELCAG
jgi:polar amino acid transport system substrate-binding protein